MKVIIKFEIWNSATIKRISKTNLNLNNWLKDQKTKIESNQSIYRYFNKSVYKNEFHSNLKYIFFFN